MRATELLSFAQALLQVTSRLQLAAALVLGIAKSSDGAVRRCETRGAASARLEARMRAGSSISTTAVAPSITGDQKVVASSPFSPASRLRAITERTSSADTSTASPSPGG